MTESEQPTPEPEHRLELIALPPIIFAAPLIIALLIHALTDAPRIQIEPAIYAWTLGALFIALGAGIGIWADRTFVAHGEHPHPFEPTSTIVTTGPYARSRNPIYLSMALVAIGIGLALRSYVALASVPVSLVLIHFLVVRREEAHLEIVLGEAYRDYKGRVRRYL